MRVNFGQVAISDVLFDHESLNFTQLPNDPTDVDDISSLISDKIEDSSSLSQLPLNVIGNPNETSKPLRELKYIISEFSPLRYSPVIFEEVVSSVCLQKWEGIIISKDENSITARLSDLTGKLPDQEAQIPIKEISDSDIPQLKCGAVFYWHIGLKETKKQRERFSLFIFRLLPSWRQKDRERLLEKGRVFRKRMGWE